MKTDRATLGEALYLGVMNYFGVDDPVDDYWDLYQAERDAWEREAVRIVIKDIPESDLGDAIDQVKV